MHENGHLANMKKIFFFLHREREEVFKFEALDREVNFSRRHRNYSELVVEKKKFSVNRHLIFFLSSFTKLSFIVIITNKRYLTLIRARAYRYDM